MSSPSPVLLTDIVPSDVLYTLDTWRPPKLRHRSPLPPARRVWDTEDLDVPGEADPNSYPLIFYMRHIAPTLVLREVKSLPSLVDTVAGSVDAEIRAAHLDCKPVPFEIGRLRTRPQIECYTMDVRTDVLGGYEVGDIYKDTAAYFCLPIASTMAFLPDPGYLGKELFWTRHQLMWRDDNVPRIRRKKDRRRNPHLRGKRVLATWEVTGASPEDEETMQQIQTIARSGEAIGWPFCEENASPRLRNQAQDRIAGSDAGPLCTVDPLQTPWFTSQCTPSVSPDSGSNRGAVDLPKETAYSRACAVLRRAWARAVMDDTTILVIRSGCLEYIGVRHRATRTLYLSEPIEPHNSTPGYGKIHVGIYMTAVRETLDRIEQVQGKTPQRVASATGRRRKRSDESSAKPVDMDALLNAASARTTARLSFSYGIYDSAAPATFLRQDPVGQAKSRPSRTAALEIVLTSEAIPGSTGTVHIGTMDVRPFGQLRVAVKLAFSSVDKGVLRGEYGIYQHLQSRAVQNIPHAFGIFGARPDGGSDPGPLALITTFAGDSLERPPEASLGESLFATLKSIHNAGVVHGDIRLSNICLNRDGEASIIDFSHAHVNSSRRYRKWDINNLRALFYDESIVEKPAEPENLRRSARIQEAVKKKQVEGQ